MNFLNFKPKHTCTVCILLKLTAGQLMINKRCFWVYMLLGTGFGFTPEQVQPHDSPTLVSTQLKTIYSAQGIVKFKLFTDKALHYENGDRAYPQGMYIEFFQSDKELLARGRANSVYFFAEQNIYEFRGDVELKSLREKKQLNTEELHWSPETETFYTDKFVRIEIEDEVLTGEGLSAKQDLSYYRIAKPQGVFNAKSIK